MKDDSKKTQSSNKDNSESKQKKLIIILAILLALSLAGLVARFIYLHYLADTPVTIEVPDNIISDDKEQTNGSGASGSAGFGVPANASVAADTDYSDSDRDKAKDNKKPSDNKDGRDDDNSDIPSDNPDPGDDNPADNPGDDTPGDNTGGGTSGASGVRLTLFDGTPYTKDPFNVTNMFPGDGYTDAEARYYCIRMYHDRAVRLYFRTKVTASEAPLADHLRLKVENIGTANAGGTDSTSVTILDKAFGAANNNEYYIDIPYSGYDMTDVYFRINAYLPTATGNECQNKRLKADFEWYVKDSGGGGGTVTPVDPDNPDEPDEPDNPDEPDKPDKPDKPDEPDNPDKPDKPVKPDHDGPLIKPPKTGDVTNITLWAVMTVSALLLLIITAGSKRKEDAQDDR